MATLDEVMTALRNADTAGDTAAATRLAGIAHQMRQTAPVAAPEAAPAAQTTSNPLMGAVATAEDMGGNLLDLAGKGRAYVQDRVFGLQNDPTAAATREMGKSLKDRAVAIHFDDGTLGEAYAKGGIGGAVLHASREAIASSPHIAAALNPLTALADTAAQTNQNAEDRARADGRTDPGAMDYLVGGGTAAVQELLGRAGGRALVSPGASSAVGRILKAAGTDAATGGAQAGVGYLGTHAGTKEGANAADALTQAAEGAATGVAGAGLYRGAREAADGVKTYKEVRDVRRGNEMLDKTPDQAMSSLRVAKLYDKVQKSTEDGETAGLVARDSDVFKTAKLELGQRVKDLTDAMLKAGDISRDEHAMLVLDDNSPFKQAIVHNRAFGADQLDRVDTLSNASDEHKALLRDALRDLNTTTYNSMWKNGQGPAERFAAKVDNPLARGTMGVLAGSALGHPMMGAAAGLGTEVGLRHVGRAVDTALGFRTPPAMQGIQLMRKAAEARGMTPRDTLGDLDAAVADTTGRSQEVTVLPASYLQRRSQYLSRKADADAARADEQKVRWQLNSAKIEEQRRAAEQKASDAEDQRRVNFQVRSAPLTERFLKQLRDAEDKRRAAEQHEADTKRLMEEFHDDPTTPRLGGWQQFVHDQARGVNLQTNHEDILAGMNRLVAEGRMTPEQAQQALQVRGSRIGTPDLLFRLSDYTAANARARGGAIPPEQLREQQAQRIADRRLTRQRADELTAQAQEKQEEQRQAAATLSLARFTPPDALQGALDGLQKARERAAATRLAKRQGGAQEGSQGPANDSSKAGSTGGSPYAGPYSTEQTQGIKNLPSYQATLVHRDAALGSAKEAADGRADLTALAHRVETAKTKVGKEKLVEEAEAAHQGDEKALAFIRGPLRSLSKIGGSPKEEAAVTAAKDKAADILKEARAKARVIKAAAETVEKPKKAPAKRAAVSKVAKAANQDQHTSQPVDKGETPGSERPVNHKAVKVHGRITQDGDPSGMHHVARTRALDRVSKALREEH